MARLKNIVHSGDACTMIFEGDRSKPEPATGVIKFPGGSVEVSRCSDDSYWVHVEVERSEYIENSRIDYDGPYDIGQLPDQHMIKHIAVRVKA